MARKHEKGNQAEILLVVCEREGSLVLNVAHSAQPGELGVALAAAGFEAGHMVRVRRATAVTTPEPMTTAEAGRRGGQAVKAKHGTAYFRQIGQMGGQKLAAEKQGSTFYSDIGKRGGAARATSLGPSGYSAMGRRGGRRRADIAAEKRGAGAEAAGGGQGEAEG